MLDISNSHLDKLTGVSIVFDKSNQTEIQFDLSNTMRVKQSATLDESQLEETKRIGALISRLRLARNIKQAPAAIRAGISRNTAYRIELGDPGVALGQLLKYLDAIAPGMTLKTLLMESDPSLIALEVKEKRHRVRDMSANELKELDF